MKKIKNIILNFPNFQIQFWIFLIIVSIFVLILQIILWAEIQYSKWVNLWYYLEWSKNLIIIYYILLIISISFPIIWIFLKKHKYILFNMLFSFLYIFILISWLLWDLYHNCMDFCWFFAVLLSIIIILLISWISFLVLIFKNKKVRKV